MVYVDAFQAREFCRWLGGYLPTSEQWERAARGLDGRQWPWLDNGGPLEHANLYRLDAPSPSTMKAKDLPSGASPEGILNLVGNVWEWTRTQVISQDEGASYLPEIWNGIDSQEDLVIRGGSGGFQIFRITEVGRVSPKDSGKFIGFRCILPKD